MRPFHSLTLLALLVGGATTVAAGQQQQQTPPGRPQQIVGPNDGRRQSLLDDVTSLRTGHEVDVVRAPERLTLDLSGVDFERDELIRIDGTPITRAEFVRSLCLLVGANEIDQFITYHLIQEAKTDLESAGHPVPDLEVSEEEVLDKFEEQKKIIPQSSGMSADDWEKQVREVFGWEKFIEFQKVQLQFEKIFLPDPPPGFLEKQNAVFQEMYKEWQARQEQGGGQEQEGGGTQEEAAAQQLPPVPEADLSFIPPRTFELLDENFGRMLREQYSRGQVLHPILRTAASAAIKRNLLQNTEVNFYPDVPASEKGDVFFTVEGRPVYTEEIATLVQGRIDDSVRRLALREILTLRAVDAALQRDGAAYAEGEADAAFAALQEEYAQSIIPLEKAVQLRGFYNLYHYRRYFDRKRAYHRWLEQTLPEEALRDHFEKGGRLFFEHGSVDGVVLFLSGEDREEVGARMATILERVDAGESFVALTSELGEYPDNQDVRRGRVPARNRNRLRQALGETEYIAFVTGYSLADEVFYRAVEGDIIGPVWRDYAPKLTGQVAFKVGRFYTTGSSRAFLEARDSVIEDLADLTFPRYASEALALSRIELPSDPE